MTVTLDKHNALEDRVKTLEDKVNDANQTIGVLASIKKNWLWIGLLVGAVITLTVLVTRLTDHTEVYEDSGKLHIKHHYVIT